VCYLTGSVFELAFGRSEHWNLMAGYWWWGTGWVGAGPRQDTRPQTQAVGGHGRVTTVLVNRARSTSMTILVVVQR
jgi:hypothetical protein